MLENLLEKLLSMSLFSCYVILVVLLIRLLLRKCERKYSFLLWFVVFLNLCIPFSIQGPFSLIPSTWVELSRELSEYPLEQVEDFVPADMVQKEDSSLTGNMPLVSADTLSSANVPAQNEAGAYMDSEVQNIVSGAEKVNLTWQTVAAGIWLAVAAVIWGISIFKGIALSRRLKKSGGDKQPAEEGIVCLEDINAPFLWGIRKPVIYLPCNVEEEEKAYIIAHESYHRKRFDHITKPVVFAIVTIHWFNPLVWLAYALFVRDMEISCDEAVLAHTQKDIKKQYASSLLKYAAKQNGFVLSPLTFGEPSLKFRIRNVLQYKKKGIAVTVIAICLVGLTACGLILRPEESNDGNIAQNGENTTGQTTPEPDGNFSQPTEVPEPDSNPPQPVATPEPEEPLVSEVLYVSAPMPALSQEEIAWFNESFFNQGYLREDATPEERIRNQFLTCEYGSPEEINLTEVFYNGMGEELTEEDWECLSGEARWQRALYTADIEVLSEEEHAQVAVLAQEMDVVRASREGMEAILCKYTGQSKPDIFGGVGMKNAYFNKKDSVFYWIHSDTNSLYIQVEDGYRNDDGTITLNYLAASSPNWMEDANEYVAVLEETADGYCFRSNRSRMLAAITYADQEKVIVDEKKWITWMDEEWDPENDAPNGYIVRDVSDAELEYTIAENCIIGVLDDTVTKHEIYSYASNYKELLGGSSGVLFHLEVENGEVVSFREQYEP